MAKANPADLASGWRPSSCGRPLGVDLLGAGGAFPMFGKLRKISECLRPASKTVPKLSFCFRKFQKKTYDYQNVRAELIG
jgi:hypothetical protein